MVLKLKIPKNFDKIKEEIEGMKREMIMIKVKKKDNKKHRQSGAKLNLISLMFLCLSTYNMSDLP